jgi:hypothetical protein
MNGWECTRIKLEEWFQNRFGINGCNSLKFDFYTIN